MTIYHSFHIEETALENERKALENNIREIMETAPELQQFIHQAAFSLIDKSDQFPFETDIKTIVSNSVSGLQAGDFLQESTAAAEIDISFEKNGTLEELAKIIDELTYNLKAYNLYLGQKEAMPAGIPVKGVVGSQFGLRKSPFNGVLQIHRGIDIIAKHGTPIHATGNGIIEFAGTTYLWGKNIIIDHGFGIKSQYGHLSKISVKNGDRIKKDDIIGELGSTGRSTGPHLHYQIWVNDVPRDPKLFFAENEAKNLKGFNSAATSHGSVIAAGGGGR
ncbi:M23 family metallopeptidase [candidate division KSB1 bacterium]